MTARRPWAWLLVPVYGATLAAKDALRVAGLLSERRLGWPVISIGSLSVGGAGKTPLTIALTNLLSERGWTVDVLSRGYRRSGRGVERVDLLDARPAHRFGDEPTLIARRTGVPVWVGSDRYAAGRQAERLHQAADGAPERQNAPQAHLLDDALQHRGLARDFELVLVTAEDLVDRLLPAGNLREPLTGLRRANALVVREDELPAIQRRLRSLVGNEIPLWTIRRTLRFPAPLGIFGAGLRPLAFCALARPEGFAEMLAKAGCGIVDTVIFSDHHSYDQGDLTDIIRLGKRLHATGLITTEKDAVKLSPADLARLEAELGPVMIVALDTTFVYEAPVIRALENRLEPSTANLSQPDEVRSR